MSDIQKPKDATVAELREILTDFWLSVIENPSVEVTDKLKSSELLAKHILQDGKTAVKRRGPVKPSTADILKIVTQLENGNGKQNGSASS